MNIHQLCFEQEIFAFIENAVLISIYPSPEQRRFFAHAKINQTNIREVLKSLPQPIINIKITLKTKDSCFIMFDYLGRRFRSTWSQKELRLTNRSVLNVAS